MVSVAVDFENGGD